MKISILTSVFFQKTKEVDGYDRIIYGGAERYLVELGKFLQSLGHEVTVYQAIKGDKILRKEYQGIPIKCLPIEDKWDYHNAPMLNQLFYELTLHDDLRIYFASFLAYPFVKSPSLSINHGIFWDYAGGHVSSYTEEQKKEFFKRQMFGMTAPDICVAVDTNIRNSVATMFPFEERKILYIPNFVDTKEFFPRQEPKTWDKVRVLFPRRLSQLRGINEFLHSASELQDYDFYLCGQAFDETAEEQFNQFSEHKNVKLTMRPMEEMAQIYREADIAVIPTRASEGTSLSCIEAMASGLPIVTTPVGGLPNLIIDKWNGLVVDLNHNTLTNSIKELAESKSLREKFSKRNIEMAHESFSIDVWKEKWLNVINKIIK